MLTKVGYSTDLYSSIAQSVERMTVNHDVTGSSPVRGAIAKASKNHITLYAPLAQLVEQLTLNQWVQGSSPWRCTKKVIWFFALCEQRICASYYTKY